MNGSYPACTVYANALNFFLINSFNKLFFIVISVVLLTTCYASIQVY